MDAGIICNDFKHFKNLVIVTHIPLQKFFHSFLPRFIIHELKIVEPLPKSMWYIIIILRPIFQWSWSVISTNNNACSLNKHFPPTIIVRHLELVEDWDYFLDFNNPVSWNSVERCAQSCSKQVLYTRCHIATLAANAAMVESQC